jgi:hypothetical protein
MSAVHDGTQSWHFFSQWMTSTTQYLEALFGGQLGNYLKMKEKNHVVELGTVFDHGLMYLHRSSI